MHRRLTVALVALIALTAFAPVPFPKPDKKNKNASLQGTWVLMSLQSSSAKGVKGKAVSRRTRMKVRIEGDKWYFEREGLGAIKTTPNYTITLDNSKNPKWIDLQRSTASRTTLQGIYQVEGDTLKILYTTGTTRSRPTSFSATSEARQTMLILKRDKP